MVQHDLHHRELVQVGVEQRLDDHPGRIVTFARCAAVTRSMPTRMWSLCNSGSMRCPSSRRATTSAPAPTSSSFVRQRRRGGTAALGRGQQADQRARRDARRAPGVPQRLPPVSLPRAGERFLRMAVGRGKEAALVRAAERAAAFSRWEESSFCGRACAASRSSPPPRTTLMAKIHDRMPVHGGARELRRLARQLATHRPCSPPRRTRPACRPHPVSLRGERAGQRRRSPAAADLTFRPYWIYFQSWKN